MRSKSILFLIALVSISLRLSAQNGFFDDFSDGNINANPTWQGEVSKFIVNPNIELQLNDTSAAGLAYLSTSSSAILEGVWQFYIRLNFNPSANNFAKVYLTSSESDLTQELTGYYVQIGGQSGTIDDVSLYRQDGNSNELLIDGIDGTVGISPALLVRVTKDSLANWELRIDTSANFSAFSVQGNAIDSTYLVSNFAGIYCKYTSTRSDKFFFDDFDFSGKIFVDSTPPVLNSLTVLDSQTVELSFSELLDDSLAKINSNYSINKGIGFPQTVSYVGTDSTNLRLSYSSSFTSGENYELTIEKLKDRNGNVILTDSSSFSYLQPAKASFRDIQINEFYPDVSSSNGLPEVEYIELFNASKDTFDLQNWSISDGTAGNQLASVLLNPGEYLIICPAADVSEFSNFGQVQGVSPFPTLNNGGDSINLYDHDNRKIDGLVYTKEWYKDVSKSNGGWSIEQINPQSKCFGIDNYSASTNSIGGTPGQSNSVLSLTPDQIPPELINVIVLSQDSIELIFNESIDSSSIQSADYLFSNTNRVRNVATSNTLNKVLLFLQNPIDSGIIVDFEVRNIQDCSGNSITINNTAQIILPQKGKPFDLVINEVLFNPKTGGSDFVEIYNRSEKIISLKNWAMANAEGSSNKKLIIDSNYLVFPMQYVGLSENVQNILENYPNTIVDRFIEVTDLPSFNDDKGTVTLVNEDDLIIDQFNYREDMHFELLNDEEGVSLERINPNVASDYADNFHSASESAGFATPGFLNSQFFSSQESTGDVAVEPKTFSPDNDGYQDVLSINYTFESPGYVANVSIYDRNGRLIKRLVQNELLGEQGSFIWNGINDDHQKARIGIYVVLFEAFNASGDQEVFKLPTVLAGYLD